jgi:protein-L-isoaspartate(D-aspartate) O-methyltransferase
MRSARVRAAFEATPREHFLPESQRRFAGSDQALPLSHGQTNSQPTTVRNMLELLDVQPGHKVLDVGAGSGWTTALLAHLVGPQGRVYGVELLPELVELGRANLAGLGLPQAGIDQAEPGVLGLPGEAPYDRILVSAEARRMPDSLVDQLAERGVMVVPVNGRMARVERGDKGPRTSWHGHYRFVPLVEGR